VWNELASWHFLKDPTAISTAVLGAVLIAILSNSFDPTDTFNLVWIVTTILLIMIYGSAERIMFEAVFRMVGTIIGVGIGALLAFGEGEMVKNGAQPVAQYSYELSLEVFVVFLVAVTTKLFPMLGDLPFFTGLTVAILIFSPDLRISYQRTLSVLLAVAAAFICTVLFHFTMADELLFHEHRVVASNVLRLTELAISFPADAKREFDSITFTIRKALNSADVAWRAYAKWRQLTLRKPPYDFAFLTEALRPLYYESFSLFWSHTETTLRPSDSRILYCDTEEDYATLFHPLVHNIMQGIRDFRRSLDVVIQPTSVTHDQRANEIHSLVNLIGGTFHLNLELLNARYAENRLACFSSRSQRWCMCDYMLSLACVLMEMVEYLKRVISLFADEDVSRYGEFQTRLTQLKESLNTLKHESRIILDVTPALTHPPVIGEIFPNPDFSRSERRLVTE
jgi:hypothetical protein